MIPNFARAVVCVAMVCSAQAASASPIEAGDWVHFKGTLGTLGGGAFKVDDLTDPTVEDFLTFCVQETQYIDYTHLTRVAKLVSDIAFEVGNLPKRPLVDGARMDPRGVCKQ